METRSIMSRAGVLAGHRPNSIAVKEHILCGACSRVRTKDHFSKRQLSAVRARAISGLLDGIHPTIKCRECTGNQVTELICTVCRKRKDLVEFSKTQRRAPDLARCMACVRLHLDTQPGIHKPEEPDLAMMNVDPNASNPYVSNPYDPLQQAGSGQGDDDHRSGVPSSAVNPSSLAAESDLDTQSELETLIHLDTSSRPAASNQGTNMHAPHASGASVDVTEAITLVSATEGSQADEESPADGDQSLDAEDESQDADLDSRDADDESQTAKGSQAAEGSRASPETLDDLNWSEQPRHHRYRDNNNTTTNNDDDVSVTDKGSDVARSDVAVSDVAVSDIVGMMDNHRLEQKAPSVAESTESQYLPLIRTAVERIGPSKRGDFPKVKKTQRHGRTEAYGGIFDDDRIDADPTGGPLEEDDDDDDDYLAHY